jgi:NADH:ubiquinone oxidoreductase subunit
MGLWTRIKRLLTWWDGQTLNTQFYTWRKGVKVGQDADGNVYYRTANDARRWVIYNGEIEGSRVSPDWHGWLHRTWDKAPTEAPLARKPWEKPHVENLTGTAMAYAPATSIRRIAPAERRPDYEAWSPE